MILSLQGLRTTTKLPSFFFRWREAHPTPKKKSEGGLGRADCSSLRLDEKKTMRKTIKSIQNESPENAGSELPAPQGIGMAVAFDWGLTVQLLFMPFVPLFARNASMFPRIGSNALLSALLYLLVSLPFAALLAIFGEGVRRGWRWTRPIQLVANALLSLVGIVGLWSLWNSLKAGDYWGLVTSVILVIFSPLITWRLSRPATGAWFRRVSSAQARLRHGGAWPWLIAIWAIVGGVLQALAASLK